MLLRAAWHEPACFPREHGPRAVVQLLVTQLVYLRGLAEVASHVIDLFAALLEHSLDLAQCLTHDCFLVQLNLSLASAFCLLVGEWSH